MNKRENNVHFKCSSLLFTSENTVLQWEFKLNSALTAAEIWDLKRLYAEG